jgi:hypothetical protein
MGRSIWKGSWYIKTLDKYKNSYIFFKIIFKEGGEAFLLFFKFGGD